MWWITVTIVIFYTCLILLSLYSNQLNDLLRKKKLDWPPHVSKCPEYWMFDERRGKCVRSPNCDPSVATGEKKCANGGRDSADCKEFPPFSGDMSEHEKTALHHRARVCDVQWNGVH